MTSTAFRRERYIRKTERNPPTQRLGISPIGCPREPLVLPPCLRTVRSPLFFPRRPIHPRYASAASHMHSDTRRARFSARLQCACRTHHTPAHTTLRGESPADVQLIYGLRRILWARKWPTEKHRACGGCCGNQWGAAAGCGWLARHAAFARDGLGSSSLLPNHTHVSVLDLGSLGSIPGFLCFTREVQSMRLTGRESLLITDHWDPKLPSIVKTLRLAS